MELHAQIACVMPRELAKKGCDWKDRAVYSEAILYCRENLTDGVISRGELGFWMPDMPIRERTRRLDCMTEHHALELHPDGWRFPDKVWQRWNPSKAEVDAKREEERQRKAEWRARRNGSSRESPNGTHEGQTQLSHDSPAVCPSPVPDSHSHSHSHSHKPSKSETSLRAANGDVGEVIKGLFRTIDEEASA